MASIVWPDAIGRTGAQWVSAFDAIRAAVALHYFSPIYNTNVNNRGAREEKSIHFFRGDQQKMGLRWLWGDKRGKGKSAREPIRRGRAREPFLPIGHRGKNRLLHFPLSDSLSFGHLSLGAPTQVVGLTRTTARIFYSNHSYN